MLNVWDECLGHGSASNAICHRGPPSSEDRLSLCELVHEKLERLLHGRRVALLAPHYDAFFEPVLGHLSRYGAELAGALAWETDPAFAKRAGVPVCHLKETFGDDAPATFEEGLWRLPDCAAIWIESIDPDQALLFIGNQFVDIPQILGRSVLGWRPAAWADWEDKTLVGRKTSMVPGATPDNVVLEKTGGRFEGLAEWRPKLDRGHGLVLSTHGGAGDRGASAHNIFVGSDAPPDIENVVPKEIERLRIATFEPGIPCSINGIVLGPETVMVFDPIEVVTLRDVERGHLTFRGTSNFWRPGADAVVHMRARARRIVLAAASQDDFRGGFSVDGIWTGGEFLFTEFNARPASGIGLRAAWPDFPLFLLGRAVMARGDLFEGLPAARLENAIRSAVVANPSLSLTVPCGHQLQCELVAVEVAGRRRTIALRPGGSPDVRAVRAVLDMESDGYIGDVIAAVSTSLSGRRHVANGPQGERVRR